MKRMPTIVLAITMALSMAACQTAPIDDKGTPNTETTETTEITDTQTNATDDVTTQATTESTTEPTQKLSTYCVGNLEYCLVDDTQTQEIEDGYISICLLKSKAYAGIIYTDLTGYDATDMYLAKMTQHKVATSSRGETQDEEDYTATIAGFTAAGEEYHAVNSNGITLYGIDVTFMDTQFAYTVMFFCNGQDNNLDDYLQLYSDFIENITFSGLTDTSTDQVGQTGSDTTVSASATAGEQNALESAKHYIAIMAFSRCGLIDQLEYDGYTTAEATYAADNCGADWDAQAKGKASDYLDVMAFSRSGLIKQLEYDQFTSDQAKYGVDNCGADWNDQAVKAAASYLDLMRFSRAELIAQLEYDGFTNDQAIYGVDKNGL